VKKHFKILKNRYFYTSLTLILFLLIFEETSVFNLYKMKTELKKIEIQNIDKENEIQQVKEKMHQLTTNKDELEKFAREHYLMKKKDEVIYLFK
jgi:cell division protein DivIC